MIRLISGIIIPASITITLLFSHQLQAITLEPQLLTIGTNSIELNVPQNMEVQFVASLSGPRFLSKGPDNEFLIGSRTNTLYRVSFPYKSPETLAQLSGFLHSVIYHQGKIYAAETRGIWSADYAGSSSNLVSTDFTKVITLPSATGGHSSRTIVAGPDNNLYIGLGISGNCSDEYLDDSYPFEQRRGGVYMVDNTLTLKPYSSGLRNPIGLAFHPLTGVLYATNAGPDNLGYDRPPEVLAPLSQNSFHGMPWFQYYDGTFKSGECATSTPPRPATAAVAPAALFPARSTPEGLAFLDNTSLGSSFNGDAVVAIHGSWAILPGQGNSSRRPPQLSLVNFEQNQAADVVDLVTGFQRADGSRFARPCGVAIGADGHLYFTSDAGEVTGLFRLVPKAAVSRGIVSPILDLLLGDKKTP